MSSVIQVDNISKAYQIGEFSTGTIVNDLQRWWLRKRGKEDPFMKIGEVNDRTVKGESNVVWSLRDISFDVNRGDAVGIIGRNGAGKSTMLKVLSRITTPTTGSVKVKGRIASLLEVGTGFHPELTGKENIFLNGAMLGMRKSEIRRKFEEIVDFSGVERYIDTPVKRYSSGMYVRLAFAVAAHLESEIMIVDEVLAVGDAEFQKKCLGKMKDVSTGEGRTVLFVSHNMAAIKNLCSSVIILDKGAMMFNGNMLEGIRTYLDNQSGKGLLHYFNQDPELVSGCKEIRVENEKGELSKEFGYDEDIFVTIRYKIDKAHLAGRLSLQIVDDLERIVFTTEKEAGRMANVNGEVLARVIIPSKILVPNNYSLTATIHIPNFEIIEALKDVVAFEIMETGSEFYLYEGSDYGCVFVDCKWEKTI